MSVYFLKYFKLLNSLSSYLEMIFHVDHLFFMQKKDFMKFLLYMKLKKNFYAIKSFNFPLIAYFAKEGLFTFFIIKIAFHIYS